MASSKKQVSNRTTYKLQLKDIIYLDTSNNCSMKYIGSTSTQLKVRFRNHKLSLTTKKNKTCQVSFTFPCDRSWTEKYGINCGRTNQRPLRREALLFIFIPSRRPTVIYKFYIVFTFQIFLTFYLHWRSTNWRNVSYHN